MADAEPETDSTFEQSRREARRAQWALNILVGMSALAGAIFFAYVLYTVKPFGAKTPEPIDVPVSSAGPRIGLLIAEDAGLEITLRDIDDAPSYREQLSETMRRDLGISQPGRLYLLIVRSTADEPVVIAAPKLSVAGKDGARHQVRWLSDVADAGSASGTGKLRLTQSAHEFTLAKGESRQLFVFIEGTAPSAEDFAAGELELAGGRRVALSHTEIKVADQ